MNSFQRNVPVFSRVPVALLFLLNGLGIISRAVAARELAEYGSPASLAPVLMVGARALEVVAGSCLPCSIYARLAALGLLAFLVPMTLVAPSFWQAAGTASFTLQFLNFLKNAAMAGSVLFIGATQSEPTLMSHKFLSSVTC